MTVVKVSLAQDASEVFCCRPKSIMRMRTDVFHHCSEAMRFVAVS